MSSVRKFQSMRYNAPLATLAVVATLAGPSAAQPAHIGRLPLLATLSSNVHACTSVVTTGELRSQHITRIFDVTEVPTDRHLSLGVDDGGNAQLFSVMMGTNHARRRESESVFVFLGPNGSIVRGWRTAMTSGVPARLADDRRSGLLPADTSQINALIHALRRVCHP